MMIGGLVRDGQDRYWESQGQLSRRMGVSRRTAGDAVRNLERHGALRFSNWLRTDSGSTVRVFHYEPESLSAEVSRPLPPEVSEEFSPEVSGTFPPAAMCGNGQVGSKPQPDGKARAGMWEANRPEVSETFSQTEEPEIENRDKLAAPPRYQPESRTEIINETIGQVTDTILDKPDLLEAERQRQKIALSAKVTS